MSTRPNLAKPPTRHSLAGATALQTLALALITLAGVGLRLWHLGDKPLWLDEVIAALFSLGRALEDVPLNQVIPLDQLNGLFTYNAGLSCQQIAQTVATQSVHPPLFFCLMYRWMGWLLPHVDNWVWALRALPALVGSVMIPLGYWLGRLALSPQVGLATAALVALSPFAVYLSQEARHYTLPMALIALALALLLQLQHAMQRSQAPTPPWATRRLLGAWVGVNVIGLYVHYFFLLTVIAQAIAFGLWLWMSQQRQYWRDLAISILVIVVSYLPWLPTMMGHLSRPETDWLTPYNPDWRDRLAPLYQLPSGWILSVVALPIEAQPAAIAVPAGLAMLAVGLGLGWYIIRGLLRLRHSPTIRLIATVVALVLLQFLGIVYVLDKDITAIPRYNFVYYPGLVLLIAAGLTTPPRPTKPSQGRRTPALPLAIALIAGAISSILVVQGVVFQKGYYPTRVAQDMAFDADMPILVAVSYQSLQEVALGLSFARELEQQDTGAAAIAFIYREKGYGPVWRQFPTLSPDLPFPLNLWVIASPGMKTKDYPDRLRLRNQTGDRSRCTIVPERFNRIGFPYQLFRCRAVGRGAARTNGTNETPDTSATSG
ncbi:MAG: hypothetical protein WBA10_21815 [Elainellaceae cyanobacterium]